MSPIQSGIHHNNTAYHKYLPIWGLYTTYLDGVTFFDEIYDSLNTFQMEWFPVCLTLVAGSGKVFLWSERRITSKNSTQETKLSTYEQTAETG
jgi:hypothetical protein